MRVEEFDYELPEELIAQTPLKDREQSRLLVVDPVAQTMVHTRFSQIGQHLRPGDVLVLNNSRVLPARLYAEKEDTGAKVELLLSRPVAEYEWWALARPAKRLHVGNRLIFHQGREGATCTGVRAEVLEVAEGGLRRLRFEVEGPMSGFLERVGEVPLPPYIHTPLANRERYQTVYASQPGSVAAPTAGLHFTHRLLDEIAKQGVEIQYVTLHVGIGTFRPVKAERVEEHTMHSEVYEVPETVAAAVNRARAEGRRVIAVGTTAMRTLESAGASGVVQAGPGETDIFIYPGYRFCIVDALITNFHLPKSTLIMLVAAMMGTEFTKRVYAEAVEQRYRFFSFGDAMFITRKAEWKGEGAR
ncbi:tRNA preQ1(34) S-adenosylmethionine ribosyltransferase-isomerase QueA [Alicyclobacillus herbarius]|uniref:tRNA preQ1(34) S-adenosylmethionine ribosyltransferase-isomerase QueA n=1 Tax=Alicyclobacillus herbarius TaxID=122960 RepID=UPI000428A9EC|nr:tRNA preQ1(34) S-adenosylmethionine ribosyltransferase-isomerase QueA [Alicyclobacillus herbarius]